jgi:phage shock protein A
MTLSGPLQTLRKLEKLYRGGFRDALTDVALARLASSQAARDEIVLHDLERDLAELEQRHKITTAEFAARWLAGKMDDSVDFVDWNALNQMATEIRQRLEVLRDEP